MEDTKIYEDDDFDDGGWEQHPCYGCIKPNCEGCPIQKEEWGSDEDFK